MYKIEHKEIMLFGNSDGSFKSNNREHSKFNRISKIAKNYNKIYAKLISFLKNEKNPLKQKLAYGCMLLLKCGIRIGNEKSSEGYVSKIKGFEGQLVETYGLTTLKPQHVSFKDNKMFLDFVGKKLVEQSIEINEQLLIEYGQKFYELNKNKETWLNIDAYELTKFVKKVIGKRFTPKDLRTLRGNIEAFKISEEISKRQTLEKKKEIKKELKEICEKTSEYLGNTPAICKKSYIDKRLLEYHYKLRYNYEKIQNK